MRLGIILDMDLELEQPSNAVGFSLILGYLVALSVNISWAAGELLTNI